MDLSMLLLFLFNLLGIIFAAMQITVFIFLYRSNRKFRFYQQLPQSESIIELHEEKKLLIIIPNTQEEYQWVKIFLNNVKKLTTAKTEILFWDGSEFDENRLKEYLENTELNYDFNNNFICYLIIGEEGGAVPYFGDEGDGHLQQANWVIKNHGFFFIIYFIFILFSI